MGRNARGIHSSSGPARPADRVLPVLHHVADDAELVKIASTSLGTERFLECYLHVRGEALVEQEWFLRRGLAVWP